MKKISARKLFTKTTGLLFCLPLLFFTITFSACNLEFTEEEIAAAPQVAATAQGISLIIPKYNSVSTQYINIYRRDKTQSENNTSTYEKIGLINPARFSGEQNCFYEDLYVCKNHTYQYCVRYSSESEKIASYWSNEIKSTAGLSDSIYPDKFLYNISDVFYDEAKKTIYFSEKITIQEELQEFTPRIIISNGTKSEIFDIPSSVYSGNIILGGQSNSISLLSLLPSDFLSTDTQTVNLSISGLVGEKTNLSSDSTEESPSILSKTWTPLTAISLKDTEGKPVTSFSVLTNTGLSGDDYSDL